MHLSTASLHHKVGLSTNPFNHGSTMSLRKNLGSGLPDMPVRRTTAALPQVRRFLSTTQPIPRIISSVRILSRQIVVSSRHVILNCICAPNSRNALPIFHLASGVGGCGSCAGPGARRDTSRRSDIRWAWDHFVALH